MSDSQCNTSSLLDLARSVVRAMQPYQPGKPIEEAQREFGIERFVKLASNENPLGPSPAVLAAVAEASGDIHRYPDANGYYLKQALAAQYGVAAESITLGSGSNDILELLASAYLDSDCSAVYSQYGFLVYALATARSGARSIEVAASDFGHDAEAMAAAVSADTRLIYIANPNNPTGTYISRQALLALLDGVPASTLVVLDEAYFEYINAADYPDGLQLLDRYSNLVVVRTFSKAYGLSGLRIGYAISHPQIADMLNRVRPPFNVTSLSLVAAQAALEDRDYLARSVEENRSGMQQLTAGLSALGIEWIPSLANFISFRSPQPAALLNEALLRRGVIVRPLANYRLDDYLRVSIGTAEENGEFLVALEQSLDDLTASRSV